MGKIIIYATEEAKEKFQGKELKKKNKKQYCPTCEINIARKATAKQDRRQAIAKPIVVENYFEDEITEKDLKE